MTEAQWLASADPLAMLLPLSGVACTRKWRLFAIESFRHLPYPFNFPVLKEALALAVAEVDGIAHPPGNVREAMDRASWDHDADDPRTHLARTTYVMLSDSVKAIGASARA